MSRISGFSSSIQQTRRRKDEKSSTTRVRTCSNCDSLRLVKVQKAEVTDLAVLNWWLKRMTRGSVPVVAQEQSRIGSKTARQGVSRSIPGENLKIGLAELADRHAIYFLFLVFLLVPLVGAALL
jgi:hypothetical protein